MGISYIKVVCVPQNKLEKIDSGSVTTSYKIKGDDYSRGFNYIIYQYTNKVFFMLCTDITNGLQYWFKISKTDRRKVFPDVSEVVNGALQLFKYFVKSHGEEFHCGTLI